ncbi:uncharacterized protein PHALS_04023 [Plasmopara halstedii]|uniref:Uncharacterized protein n=1 Tax=Plasmopara halstedii TaxID=4781 RepID=A0A0P1A9L7_PLAHL|nr:uncharacterized protein PHALS_04023 [Plasmopara halstedii]CEG36774.1 hypothetical protein PHALS_04023 [Plasmopara halstedii]|eukprot:XP_024573143.1 hypothetical protein PHALS_04023 [Plasmopara halstedii]
MRQDPIPRIEECVLILAKYYVFREHETEYGESGVGISLDTWSGAGVYALRQADFYYRNASLG